MASLEAEVTKWRATARTLWRVERPKVANAIVAFAEVVRSNHQLSSNVGGVLAELLHTLLDGDELFGCYKNLQTEKMDLDGKVESLATERDGLAKVVVELEARLKESESRLEESKLRAAKERRPARSLRKS